MLILPTSRVRKLRHRESSKSRGPEISQMTVNVAEQSTADVGEGGERGTGDRASHTGLAVVCSELYMGGSHPPAAESLSGNHRELKRATWSSWGHSLLLGKAAYFPSRLIPESKVRLPVWDSCESLPIIYLLWALLSYGGISSVDPESFLSSW